MAGLSREDLEGLTKVCLVDPDDEELVFCHICLDPYEEPTLVPCPKQHVACRSCLETWVKEHSTCPTCRAELPDQDLQRMRHVANQMPRVEVYCLHRCGFQGPLSTFRDHMDRCPQHLDNRIAEEIDGLQKGVQAIDDEIGELQEDRARLVQEQERLQQLRREIHEAVDRGEVPVAMEDPLNQVRRQEMGREALRKQVTELQQAVEAERTQRQAGASETQRVQQELANHQRQDQASRRRIAELEEALEAERARHSAPAPAFQPAGRQPQVAPPNRYARLSQAEQEQNNEQLREAAQRGDVAEVARLLNEGLVDVNGQDSEWWTALHGASMEGHVNVVEQLLQAGADVNRADNDGETPLYWASAKGHVIVVERLLQARANPNQANNDGRTPLSVVCSDWSAKGSVKPEIERLLRQAGGR